MIKQFVPIVLLLVSCFSCAATTQAGDLLRVEGEIIKWRPPAKAASATVITYAVLAERYSLPSDKHTLSPDNCGVMRPFGDIVSASSTVTEAMARDELHSAFTAWEEAAGVLFVEISDLKSANIIIGATDIAKGQAFANLSVSGKPSQSLAKALGSTSEGTAIEDATAAKHLTTADPRTVEDGRVSFIEQAYVCLNRNKLWKSGFDGDLGVYDLRYTFTHEIGHAIGLDHPGSSGSIMAYRYDERVRNLQPKDIAPIQMRYCFTTFGRSLACADVRLSNTRSPSNLNCSGITRTCVSPIPRKPPIPACISFTALSLPRSNAMTSPIFLSSLL